MPRKRLRTSGHSKASSWCSATSKVTKMAWVGNWRWQFRLIVANTVINCYHLLPIVILLDTLKTCLYFFFDFGLSHHFKIKEQPWIYDLLIDRLNALLSSQILHLGPHRWFTKTSTGCLTIVLQSRCRLRNSTPMVKKEELQLSVAQVVCKNYIFPTSQANLSLYTSAYVESQPLLKPSCHTWKSIFPPFQVLPRKHFNLERQRL